MPNENRTLEARKAFLSKDVERSKAAHSMTSHGYSPLSASRLAAEHVEPTSAGGKRLRPLVFGGIDGISTIFATLCGGVGASLTFNGLLAVGFGSLVAGAFSMGIGEYVSCKADYDLVLRERNREKWEVENNPEGEIAEMIEIYTKKGVEVKDATIVANILSKYKEFWIDHMLLTELGMIPPEGLEEIEKDGTMKLGAQSMPRAMRIDCMMSGFVMWLAFVAFGSVPLITFAILRPSIESKLVDPFFVSVIVALGTMFFLGVLKSRITQQDWIKSGLSLIVSGSLSAISAYWLGSVVSNYLLAGETAQLL